MDRMEALWLENNRLTMRRIPVPDPAQGEALVRVRLAGICATDLELVRGYYPYSGVLGHEFVGEIADAPDAPERLGQRVVGEINTRCGKCDACRADRSNHCEKRTVLGIRNRNGSFAEYLLLPLENLHPVPESVPDEWAVFTEPLAAALQITRQVAIRPQDRVVLVGAGRLGQLIAQVLAATGCDLKVLARYQGQRDQLALGPVAVHGGVQPGLQGGQPGRRGLAAGRPHQAHEDHQGQAQPQQEGGGVARRAGH